jgi:hypothetical protein
VLSTPLSAILLRFGTGVKTPSSLSAYYFVLDFGVPLRARFASGRCRWRESIQLSSYAFAPVARPESSETGSGTVAATEAVLRVFAAGRRFWAGR